MCLQVMKQYCSKCTDFSVTLCFLKQACGSLSAFKFSLPYCMGACLVPKFGHMSSVCKERQATVYSSIVLRPEDLKHHC